MGLKLAVARIRKKKKTYEYERELRRTPNMNEKSHERTCNSASYWQLYLSETRRPFVSLAFVAPMLLIYEFGIIALGPQTMRNGADVWLRHFLDLIGFGQYFLLPILTVFSLLAWHHLTHEPWQFSPKLVGGMLIESIAFGIFLLAVAQLQGRLMEVQIGSFIADVSKNYSSSAQSTRIIGYFGAGIYEELLFRLLLLPLVSRIIRSLGANTRVSLIVGIVTTALVFSAAHYRIFTDSGEAFQWFSFTFRFIAGIFFAVLFKYRGFGITAGAHTLYDILAATI